VAWSARAVAWSARAVVDVSSCAPLVGTTREVCQLLWRLGQHIGGKPSAGGERLSARVVTWSAHAACHVAALGAFVRCCGGLVSACMASVSGCAGLVSACMASVITHTYIVSAQILLVSAWVGSVSARNRVCAACVALRTWKRRRVARRVAESGPRRHHATLCVRFGEPPDDLPWPGRARP
jgi:hypothetical protein